MKKILFTLEIMLIEALPRAACAQTQVYTAVSTATQCNIQISSVTPTRVDNFNGLCGGLMTGRTTLRWVNSTGTLYGGYDVTVDTISTDSRFGEIVNPSDKTEMNLTSVMTYYMIAAPGTAPWIIIQQAKAGFSKASFTP